MKAKYCFMTILFACLPLTSLAATDSDNASTRTVGELLRKADRGGSLSSNRKGQTNLPTFSNTFAKGYKPVTQDLTQVKPPRTSSFLEDGNDDKAKLEKLTDQQIRDLYKMVQKFQTSPRRGELWLRLAELYVEKAGIIDFRKQNDYDNLNKEFRAGKLKVKPKLDLREAKEYNRKAIQLYEWFSRDFPKDDKMDQALFFLGYNYFELSELNKGLSYYHRLTIEHPQSPFVTESHFALGEYFFEKEKWVTAGEHYREVVRHPRHRLAGFSTYKLAWCQFRSGKTSDAMRILEALVLQAQAQNADTSDGKKISRQRLEKEALRDLVLFYADDRKPENAPEYFGRLAGNEAPSYLERLAYLYAEKGNRDGARIVFNNLIQRNPNAAKAFDYKYQVIQAFSNASQTKAFREEMYQWVHDYGSSGPWYAANKGNSSLIESSSKLRESTLKTWVLTQHQTAQNSHAKFSQALADEGYRQFLQEFPNSGSTADMHFFYAELLYDMHRFGEAGSNYQWVVDNAPDSKYLSRAAENNILAAEQDVPKDSEISALVGKSLDPVAFGPKTKHFVDVSAYYSKKFPNGTKAAEIKFRAGRLYYQHNQFEQAIGIFKEIVRDYPKTKYAEYSANLMLDSYNLKKDYAGLEKTGQELLASPSIASSVAGGDIRNVMEKAAFKRGQDLEVAKDFGGSAQQYLNFARQNPHAGLASVALFNAAVNFERANLNHKAVEAHQLVLASPAKEAQPFKPKSRRLLGKLYQETGQLNEAAKAYSAAAVEAGKDPIAANLYFDAAILFELLNHTTEAIQNYDLAYQKSRKADRAESLYRIAKIHERLGHRKIAALHFKEYLDQAPGLTERNVEAAFYNWKHASEVQNNKDILHWRAKTIALQSKLSPGKKGPGADSVAKILLVDANYALHEFRSVHIPNDPGKQQKAVQRKIELLGALNSRLADIIKYDSPDEIVAALLMAAKANQNMGDAFVNAAIPAGLKPAEEKAYREGVQKFADPFYTKAKESAHSAVEKGQELEAYGPDLKAAQELLHQLDPAGSIDHGEIVPELRNSDWAVAP